MKPEDRIAKPFLEAAIGARGPFHGEEYMQALSRHFDKHGLTI
ncbi:hypothetical protein [Nocardia macrotermitis]|uniref:Uncharacterized protein n=1 Tax=Nocardia macrotermitis TaxID=2585198 RepID=A0A7K0D9R5_9NOCA|nr:hypothetical protein [Nocardia macrotermitis]MQY22513.1 hypothetical protein [Nocardia macrotermitis]